MRAKNLSTQILWTTGEHGLLRPASRQPPMERSVDLPPFDFEAHLFRVQLALNNRHHVLLRWALDPARELMHDLVIHLNCNTCCNQRVVGGIPENSPFMRDDHLALMGGDCTCQCGRGNGTKL